MSDKIRWGILGTGNIARQFAEGVKQSRRGTLAAVASRSAASAQTFAADFGAARAHGDYRRLIDDAGVDAIYISLPNSMHHEWTIAALNAGKHVLCEKPIASQAKQAAEMFDAAERNKRVLVEAFMYRSHPLTLAVVEAMRSGIIGELQLIRTSFCFCTRSIANNIRFNAELHGGSLMDVGCYCINFSRLHARSEPEKMHASARLHSSGVDELAAGTLTFGGGLLASFVCGMTTQTDNTAYLCGTDGYIEIPIPWKPPTGEAIYVLSHSAPPRMDKPGTRPGTELPRDVRRVPVEGHLYGIEADDFASAVIDGNPPRLTRADTLGNMRVLDELRRQVGVKV